MEGGGTKINLIFRKRGGNQRLKETIHDYMTLCIRAGATSQVLA